MRHLVILHFLPIELYPPILNFSKVISDNIVDRNDIKVILITTKPQNELELFEDNRIKVIRLNGIRYEMNLFRKTLQYIYIYLNMLIKLMVHRPKVTMYYGSLSSLPVSIYSVFSRRMKIFVHYHELFTLEQLKQGKGRFIHRYANKIENKVIYPRAEWISETNHYRLKIFLDQYNITYNSKVHKELPNYPSKSWIDKAVNPADSNHVIRLVHIGTLSFESMYLDELLQEYGNSEQFKIYFYSHSTDEDIIRKLKTYGNVIYMGSINYKDLPNLKGLYDVGLVLYKKKSLNFIYNAPNKIFEYLALDLDVWCSDKLLTAKDYQIKDTFPKMLLVDFDNLSTFSFKDALRQTGLFYKKSPYSSEVIYKPLANLIKSHFTKK